jgi:hypothetical protein
MIKWYPCVFKKLTAIKQSIVFYNAGVCLHFPAPPGRREQLLYFKLEILEDFVPQYSQ